MQTIKDKITLLNKEIDIAEANLHQNLKDWNAIKFIDSMSGHLDKTGISSNSTNISTADVLSHLLRTSKRQTIPLGFKLTIVRKLIKLFF